MSDESGKRPEGDAAPITPAENASSDAGIPTDHRSIPVVAEALGYIGGALALAAVVALISTFWVQIGHLGHVGIGVVLALVGLIAGFVLERFEGDAAKRLSQFLLLAGVAGVGLAVGFAVRWIGYEFFPADLSKASVAGALNDWAWFAGSLGVAIAGGLVWWHRHSVLQHLAFGGGVAAAALLSLPLMPFDGPAWGAGATLILVALVWGALSLRDLLPPRVVGLSLSALGLVGGVEMMALSAEPALVWAMWIGVAVSAALIWAGSRLEELGVLGVGTVALMVFAAQLVGSLLGFGAGTAIALIALGFVLLGVGVRLTLRTTSETTQKIRIASEVVGYLGVALALGGAGILMGQYWDELGIAGHIAVPAVGAAVAYGCAFLLRRSELHTAERLTQVLLAIGVLASGVTAAMIAQPVMENIFGVFRPNPDAPGPQVDYATTWTILVGTLAATAVGGVTWWFRKGSLTEAAFLAATAANVFAAISFAAFDQTETVILAAGAALVILGTVWLALGAIERLLPARTALVMGSLAALLGLQMLLRTSGGPSLNVWAAVLGIAYGVAGIVASIYLRRGTLLGFGAVYIIIFTMTLVMDRFGGRAGAPILLLAMGVLFIVLAVVVALVANRIRHTPKLPKSSASRPPLAHA